MTICIGPRSKRPAPSPDDRPGAFRSGHVKARPSPTLAPYVDYYWITRWQRRDGSSTPAAALLDPCVHLQIRDGLAELMGVMREPYRVQIAGTGCIVGARFRPGGFHPFVRQSVDRWTDRVVPLEEVFEGAATVATLIWNDVTSGAATPEAYAAKVAAHLDALLCTELREHDDVAVEMAALVALAANESGVRRVSDLARASGRSERTLHRLFARYVGVSPAWVIRRYRLHEAARRLTSSPDADVQALAYELGYADQAHFIRAFRATVGVTPGAFVAGRR